MISCLVLTLPTHSQTVTSDSVVILPKRVAIEITKDLQRLDLCKKEQQVKDSIIQDYQHIITIKNKVITTLDSNQSLYKTQISNWVTTDSIRTRQVTGLQKQVVKYRRERDAVAATSLLLIILSIALL